MMPSDHAPPCATPIEPEVLLDYWLGALPAADEEQVEEHFLSCHPCSERLRAVVGLSEGLRMLARSGTLNVVIGDELLTHARQAGQRVREYAPVNGQSIQCTVAADDDFLVARLAADLSVARRVDLSWCDRRGVELFRMTDIPVDADAGTVICQQSIAWAKGSPNSSRIARLLSVDESGGERVLGEYTFVHTRTIPGPPAWEE
jgi:hypothetical protein